MTRCVSIDIGAKHFALYIEEFDNVTLKEQFNALITGRPQKKRRGASPWDSLTLKERWNLCRDHGKCLLLELTDLTLMGTDIFVALINYLNNHKKLLDLVDVVIIEQQMSTNVQAVRIAQHVFSYFMVNYTNKVMDNQLKLRYVQPQEKLRVFETPADIRSNKRKRKQWSESTAIKFMEDRADNYGVSTLSEHANCKDSKGDDLADAVMQCQAFKLVRNAEL